MDSMPPGSLGALILTGFAVSFVIRAPFEKRILLNAAFTDRPRRQFILDFFMTILAGLVAYGLNAAAFGAPMLVGFRLMTGFAAAAFFIGLDMSLTRQRIVISRAMELGESSDFPERFKPMSRTFAIVAIGVIICASILLVLTLVNNISWPAGAQGGKLTLVRATKSVILEIGYVMVVLTGLIINVIVSYSKTISLSFKNQLSVLEKVSRGDFTSRVPVTSANEFGVVAAHTNRMIKGLEHRLNLLGALKLAEEVQRNLLPESPPVVGGLDIAAASHYSEETGGDYYDFINLPGERLAAVVGDVSGHGVASALLMASARAFLRMASDHHTNIAEIVNHVNARLSSDIRETGSFLTLFLLEISLKDRSLQWVRAGHDPALLYDPASGEFTPLDGRGLALGLHGDFGFEINTLKGWNPGCIVMIGTDGIWETHNEEKRMFGKERLMDVIRSSAAEPSKEILRRILAELKAFRGDVEQEDDVTVVLIKMD